jgi:hypothetical protein
MKGTYKWSECVKGDTCRFHAGQKRHKHAQHVHPKADDTGTAIQKRVQQHRDEQWHCVDKQEVHQSDAKQLQRQRTAPLHQQKSSDHVAFLLCTDNVRKENRRDMSMPIIA